MNKPLSTKQSKVVLYSFLALLVFALINKQFPAPSDITVSAIDTLPEPTPIIIEKEVEKKIVITEYKDKIIGDEVDFLVSKYAKRFGGENSNKYKAILHCLLYKESNYGNNKGHGDNGKAGGPLQFWNATYTGFRKIMIKEGLISHIGSRYDLEDAIETTAWALSDNRELNWGPILRKECLRP